MVYKDFEGPNNSVPMSNRHAKKTSEEDSDMELMIDNLEDDKFFDPGQIRAYQPRELSTGL
jgi:hypothetical protein